MVSREVTIEYKGRAAASVKQASEQAARAVGRVGSESEESASKARGGLTKIGAGIAGFAGGIVGNAVSAAAGKVKDFVGQSITAASDMQETLSKSRAIFGDQAKAMEQWANGAPKQFGLAKSEALGYSAGLGDMARQIGFTAKEAATFGKDIVQVSGDLGSFNNLETGDVLDRITSALRGEYDSLQAIIPNINAARVEQEALALSGKKTAKELTEQDKVLAIQAILHKDGARAMGDFAKTSGGFANQQKIAAAQVQTLQERLGTVLLPILTQVMAFVTNTAVPALAKFAEEMGPKIGPAVEQAGKFLEGLLPFVGQLATFIAENIAVLGPLTAGLALLNVVLSANPIGLVVLALGALVAGLMYAYQNSETFRNIVNGAFTAVKTVVLAVGNAVVGAVRAIADWLARTWQAAVDFGVRFVRAFQQTNERVGSWIRNMVSTVLGWVTDLRDRAVRFALQLRDRFIQANVRLRDGAVSAILGLRDKAVGFVRSLRDQGVAFVISLRDRVIGGARSMRDQAVAAVTGLRDRAVARVVSLRDRAVAFALSLRDRFIAAGRALRDRVIEAVQSLRERAVARIVALRDTAVRVALQVRDKVLAPFRALRDKGVEVFRGLRDTAGRVMSGLLDKVKGPIRTVFGWLNDKLIKPLNTVTSKFGLTIPTLPKFHRGTSRVGPDGREYPAILLGTESVLNPQATRRLGRDKIDKLNRGEAIGGPGDWWNNFTEFISRPAKLVAEMAQRGAKWAVSQVMGAIPNAPTTGVPMADLIPDVLNQLKSKITSWASGKDAEQKAELGSVGGSIGTGPWVKPVAAGIGNGYLGYPGHYGVDMPVGIGTPVHAVSNAIVTKAASLTGSYGRHLFLRHADGLVTVYAHLSQLLTSVGDRVKAGQVIGRSGNTGNSTGPHLHFETRVGGGYPGPNPRTVMRARGVTLDSGGMLQPGFTLAYNGTGGPEPVLTGSQWSDLTKAKDAPTVVINIDGALDPDAVARQVISLLDRYDRNRGGVKVNRRAR
ncbi:peptidoglycan DD-metalloendopeptidase family protein [Microlunatus parietis]|uniref:Murein DD-endopeptidase MepM/ murein hydrolase activator NlpD n=1 Tax=Microlunatus parietis TaxID=682979 RepID=A0A7Y9I2I0_9ACTN|nr:peptidoglycan DD-metalloendopeptidase family protein [Microlunatus parietis]NYE68860.1 murein DD-endopeptidase MepM/ murein hydrolase activator NlpD [Microlunatus parietis]